MSINETFGCVLAPQEPCFSIALLFSLRLIVRLDVVAFLKAKKTNFAPGYTLIKHLVNVADFNVAVLTPISGVGFQPSRPTGNNFMFSSEYT